MVNNWVVLLLALGVSMLALAAIAYMVDGWDDDPDGDNVNDDY